MRMRIYWVCNAASPDGPVAAVAVGTRASVLSHDLACFPLFLQLLPDVVAPEFPGPFLLPGAE